MVSLSRWKVLHDQLSQQFLPNKSLRSQLHYFSLLEQVAAVLRCVHLMAEASKFLSFCLRVYFPQKKLLQEW